MRKIVMEKIKQKNNQKSVNLESKSEALYSIPKTWLWVNVNQLCSKINDGTHFSPPNNTYGDIPYVTAKNIRPNKIDLTNITYISKKIHRDIYSRCNPEKGDILYTKDGSVGYSVVNPYDFEFSLLSSVALLKPIKNIIDSYFLSHYLNSPVNFYRITGKMTGTALRRVILERIKEIPIPLAPLNEQKRIVTKIEELFSKIESTLESLKEIKIKVHQYRISLIKWIFFGDYRQKFSFSSNWEQGTVGDFFEIVGGGTPSTKHPEYWGGKIPWITSADIYGIKDIRPRRTVTKLGIDDSVTNIIPKNSILVVTRAGLGKLAILEQDMCINQDIQALIPRNSDVYSFFALHYLSEMVQIFKYQSRGTTINGVTKKQLSELPFSLPSINEQKKIVDFIEIQLTELSNIKQVVEKNYSILNSVKNSILKQAFEGKLVPQNPNDESAEILLERIKQEKQKIISSKPRRKKNDK